MNEDLNIFAHFLHSFEKLKIFDFDKIILIDPSETRTKESNVHARIKVKNFKIRNESKFFNEFHLKCN